MAAIKSEKRCVKLGAAVSEESPARSRLGCAGEVESMHGHSRRCAQLRHHIAALVGDEGAAVEGDRAIGRDQT